MVLVKYEKTIEKVAMSLLSFMPGERELKNSQKTMQKYEEDPAWQLYLWRQGDDFIGLIGIEADEHTYTVHHASVTPSCRSEGIGHAMVEKVQELQEPRAMKASKETKDFLAKCWDTIYPTL